MYMALRLLNLHLWSALLQFNLPSVFTSLNLKEPSHEIEMSCWWYEWYESIEPYLERISDSFYNSLLLIGF